MEEQSLYLKDIWNFVLNCLISCQKVIDAINYYEISDISKELSQDLRHILRDILYAIRCEGIMAANELLQDKNSPLNYNKIRNRIKNEKFEKSFKKKLTQKIDNWENGYKDSDNYQVLTDKSSGLSYLRDKVFAHTDSSALFIVIETEFLVNLKDIVMDLYYLYRELLIDLSCNEVAKNVIAKAQPTSLEYFNQSKQKAALLKNVFTSGNSFVN